MMQDISRTLKHLEIQNFYERLEVEPDADLKVIRKAYMTLAAKWHPDKFTQYDLGSHKVLLQRLFGLLTEAHSTLTHPQKREEYDASQSLGKDTADVGALLNADNEFRLGVQLLERGQAKGAHKKFESACAASPGTTQFEAYYAWTTYLMLPRDLDSKPVGADQIEATRKLIEKAVAESDKFDMGNVFLGQLAVENGDIKAGRKLFNLALSQNPKNYAAQRQLRLLNMRKDGNEDSGGGGGGGFLGKLKALLTKKR